MSPINITQLSPAISQANLGNQVSMAVLAKTMDAGEQLGENMVAMLDSAAMERSVNPSVGSNIDISV